MSPHIPECRAQLQHSLGTAGTPPCCLPGPTEPWGCARGRVSPGPTEPLGLCLGLCWGRVSQSPRGFAWGRVSSGPRAPRAAPEVGSHHVSQSPGAVPGAGSHRAHRAPDRVSQSPGAGPGQGLTRSSEARAWALRNSSRSYSLVRFSRRGSLVLP